MNRKNKKLSVLAVLLGVLAAAGCGNATTEPTEDKAADQPVNAQADAVVTEKATPEATPETTPEITPETTPQAATEVTQSAYENGLKDLRFVMEPSASIAGVFFLGVREEELTKQTLAEVILDGGYEEEYGFLKGIPEENYIQAPGAEIYCLVPADPYASVTVDLWDEAEAPGPVEELYHSDNGSPVILKGNISDIMPNLSVDITDSFGNTLTDYHPRISLKDGSVITPEDPEPIVLDFTIYDTSVGE